MTTRTRSRHGRPLLPGLFRRCALTAGLLLMLGGCSATRPLADAGVDPGGPFAVPFADSVDMEWGSDTTATPPRTSVRPKPKKKKAAAPAPSPAPTTTTGQGATVVPPAVPGAGAAAPGDVAAPAGDPTAAPDARPPQLTVKLSPEETARLDERIQSDLTRAERALDAVKELSLSGEPADQLAAARRFLSDARAARATRDFLRGAELAEKARVLSEAVRATVQK